MCRLSREISGEVLPDSWTSLKTERRERKRTRLGERFLWRELLLCSGPPTSLFREEWEWEVLILTPGLRPLGEFRKVVFTGKTWSLGNRMRLRLSEKKKKYVPNIILTGHPYFEVKTVFGIYSDLRIVSDLEVGIKTDDVFI